ncbi:MAG: hypothetical protein HYX76_03880 [Acidobacteria bacterium]|nr:hypothetical protein [Acidobacteriota bacterium]
MRRALVYVLIMGLTAFLAYRMVRPMNIFVVGDAFARPLPVTQPPAGLQSISAAECGGCHSAIYDEWSESLHAHAWTEPCFQVDFAFDGSQQICLNCHTPLQNQQANLVLGFRDAERIDPILASNDAFDPNLRAEGVTCAVCHVKDAVIVGPYGDTRAPHPTRRDPAMTDGVGTCVRCHVVSGNRWDTFYRIPPCGTVVEIQEGTGTTPDCTGCHMPEVVRPLWHGGAPRPGRRHLWRGGHDPDTVRQGLAVDIDLQPAAGRNRRRVVATLTNIGADHYLPTGTPDRHLTLSFRLLSGDGAVLKQKRYALKRTIMWRPFIVDLWDTRLPSQQPQTYVFQFPIETSPPPATLDVVVRYHLLDEARRRRIGYENQKPISHVIYERRLSIADGETPPVR